VSIMTHTTPSEEFTIDLAMEDILSKVAAGTASSDEKTELAQLSARRARLMRRPRILTGRRRVTAL